MIAEIDDLPRTEEFCFDDAPPGERMEFRLVYRGQLVSGQSKHRVPEKHRIRQSFHRQLTELWRRVPALRRQLTDPTDAWTSPPNMVRPHKPNTLVIERVSPGARGAIPWVERIANDFSRCGFRFVPLVRRQNGFTCALDILFLRRSHPGDLFVDGDIDNRIKTLIDSLRMPRSASEIQASAEEGEDPFYCLLEDDTLITRLTVTTDRLLTPLEGESEKGVELVIHVTVTDPGALLGENGLV